jgi:hypothetical protein
MTSEKREESGKKQDRSTSKMDQNEIYSTMKKAEASWQTFVPHNLSGHECHHFSHSPKCFPEPLFVSFLDQSCTSTPKIGLDLQSKCSMVLAISETTKSFGVQEHPYARHVYSHMYVLKFKKKSKGITNRWLWGKTTMDAIMSSPALLCRYHQSVSVAMFAT